jgi:hypothetical protein
MSIWAITASFHILSYSSFTNNPAVQRYIVKTLTASKNNPQKNTSQKARQQNPKSRAIINLRSCRKTENSV